MPIRTRRAYAGAVAEWGAPIVVQHRKELSYLLCQAAEIEHLAMCQYLYAAFSLRTEMGPGLTAPQLEAVERWRRELFRIAGEEMLHWALVNNLLTAIGSAPFVSRPNLPHRAKGYPPNVQFALLPFGESALRHFVYFERPEDADVDEALDFEPAGVPQLPMTADEIQPRSQDFVSQGELYRALDDGLEHLAEELGEAGLFIGPASAQAGPSSFGWPDLIAVHDLASAKVALRRIIEQGEGGSSRDVATAHYGRFVAILDEYLALRAEDPAFDPAHPVSAAMVRTIEDEERSGPLITDPTTAATSDLFNAINDLLLHVLSRFFAFGEEDETQLATLSRVALGLMFDAIRPLGELLARLPVGGGHPGATAGANFQLAYRTNFLLPHRRVAWIRYAERLEDAARFAVALEAPEVVADALGEVASSLRRASVELLSHVPSMAEDHERDPHVPEPGITVDRQGPYRVQGRVPIRRVRYVRSAHGEPMTTEVLRRYDDRDGTILLCRCGGSSDKPFCDGTHSRRTWQGDEAAPDTTYEQRASAVEGGAEDFVVHDDRGICSHAGFCATKLTSVWAMVGELAPDDTITRAYLMAMIERCPSGALTYRTALDGDDIEPELAASVAVVEDGPLHVTGGVAVHRSDGAPFESRNRMVLCRCGHSSIKPLCDGSHTEVGFRG
jgi:CDGSH-type Zn-finger protein